MNADLGIKDGAVEGETLHAIGKVARLVGVSHGLLRLWEREGLIYPQRTAGGHRFYTEEDIVRLRRIVHLRRVDRLNAAAIRRELGYAERPSAPERPDARPETGRRLRALRTGQGLSLAIAAERVGLSTSFLSAVERGQASISLANLFKLADIYGTTVPGLYIAPQNNQRIVHPADRPRFVDQSGLVVIEDLITHPGALEAQRIEIQAGGGSEEAYTHPGEEFLYVLSGQLDFWIDENEHYRLQAGDALYLPSTQAHRWRNAQEIPAVVLWINAPLVVANAPGASTERRQARQRPT